MHARALPLLLFALVTTPSATYAAAAGGPDLEQGRALYEHFCSACHDPGPGHPGTMRLGLRSDPAHAVLIERTDLPAVYVIQIVRSGLQMMPPFRPTEIGDRELVALAAFVTQHLQAQP